MRTGLARTRSGALNEKREKNESFSVELRNFTFPFVPPHGHTPCALHTCHQGRRRCHQRGGGASLSPRSPSPPSTMGCRLSQPPPRRPRPRRHPRRGAEEDALDALLRAAARTRPLAVLGHLADAEAAAREAPEDEKLRHGGSVGGYEAGSVLVFGGVLLQFSGLSPSSRGRNCTESSAHQSGRRTRWHRAVRAGASKNKK